MKILTQEQEEFFDDNGFLVVPQMYSQSEMVEMRDQFHDLIALQESLDPCSFTHHLVK